MRGSFVSFEGPEGGGKSSVCKAVVDAFDQDILLVREPGSTVLGEKIRTLLMTEDMPARSELMLFEAARSCIVDSVIVPALEAGKTVLCDRFTDSTLAYQGYGRGINFNHIAIMNDMATNGLTPDLTIVFNIDPVVGMRRKGKATDRIEAAGIDFHQRVSSGFIEMVERNPGRMVMVDASMPIDAVISAVCGILEARCGWKRKQKETES